MNNTDIDNLINNLEKIKGTNEYKISEILSDEFIKSNTKFKTFNELIEKLGLKMEKKSFDEIYKNKEFNEFINLNTKFNNLDSMLEYLFEHYL